MQSEIEFYQLTSAGDRCSNQDCMTSQVTDNYALFIVADGLGGHHAGEKASQFFCRGMLTFLEKYQPSVKDNPESVFTHWLNDAVAEMLTLFSGDPDAAKAHTTCAVLYLEEGCVITAHCGDSRIYKMNQKEILWRTKDHSLTQNLLDEGRITELEMGLHPEQNQLTRSINVLNKHKVDIATYPSMKKGETFILCTDGFWEFIKKQELLELAQPTVNKNDLKRIAKLMLFRAQGRSDNITVQLVRAV